MMVCARYGRTCCCVVFWAFKHADEPVVLSQQVSQCCGRPNNCPTRHIYQMYSGQACCNMSHVCHSTCLNCHYVRYGCPNMWHNCRYSAHPLQNSGHHTFACECVLLTAVMWMMAAQQTCLFQQQLLLALKPLFLHIPFDIQDVADVHEKVCDDCCAAHSPVSAAAASGIQGGWCSPCTPPRPPSGGPHPRQQRS